jgi:hypothetical protein
MGPRNDEYREQATLRPGVTGTITAAPMPMTVQPVRFPTLS